MFLWEHSQHFTGDIFTDWKHFVFSSNHLEIALVLRTLFTYRDLTKWEFFWICNCRHAHLLTLILKCGCCLLIHGSNPGLEGFGRYPVFTAVNTGKYRPGKNRFWTPKVGKTGKNTSTGKYRPGKNRFWTPKVGKTGKNTSTGKYRPGKNRFWTPKVRKTYLFHFLKKCICQWKTVSDLETNIIQIAASFNMDIDV